MTSKPVMRGIAVVSTALALACFVFMHVVMPHVHPIEQPVSMFALEPAGKTAFLAGTFGLALASAVTAVVRSGWARLTLGLAAVAFVLTVVFPTDPGKGLVTVGGHIHRYASGTAFGLVILAGFLAWVLERGERRGYGMLALSVVDAILLITIVVNTFFPLFLDGGVWRGLPQRMLLVGLSALLVALSWLPATGAKSHDRGSTEARLNGSG